MDYSQPKIWWQSEVKPEQLNLPRDELFGLFCMVATMLEASEEEQNLSECLKDVHRPWMEHLTEIFLARIQRRQTGQMPLEINRCGFSSQQQELVGQWVRGEINFVGQIEKSQQEISG